MSKLQSRELRAEEFDLWQSLLAASPDGSIYNSPAYLSALCKVTGDRFKIVGVFRETELEGGVALYEKRLRSATSVGLRSLLYYNGPVIARSATRYPSLRTAKVLHVQECLIDHLSGMGYQSIALKGMPSLDDVRPFLSAGWKVWPAYSYVVPLEDLASQWLAVEQNLRRLIRRCKEREGLVCVADDDFETFWDIYSGTLARRGLAPYLAKRAFAEYFGQISQQGLGKIFHARLSGGEAVATQLVLTGPFATTHTVCAGSDDEKAPGGANAFLRWHVFEHLAGLGYKSNDLTDAALNSVTHFKSQLGGRLAVAFVLETPRSLLSEASSLADRGARAVVGRLKRWQR